MGYIDPISIETLPELRQKEFFKIDPEWTQKKRYLDPEGYAELVDDWRACELDAKYWRQFEQDKKSNKLSNEFGWSQIPTLVVPRILDGQLRRRFGPMWGSFNFLRYGIWYFYPRLRTTKKYYAKRKGISRKHIPADFNQADYTKGG